ncbi:hypothetical protein F4604DRAFT_1683990 [Suillus subluteus]|nr:hypothetical protein F4604DRAFT_1683990 [Suillus subluteus]
MLQDPVQSANHFMSAYVSMSTAGGLSSLCGFYGAWVSKRFAMPSATFTMNSNDLPLATCITVTASLRHRSSCIFTALDEMVRYLNSISASVGYPRVLPGSATLLSLHQHSGVHKSFPKPNPRMMRALQAAIEDSDSCLLWISLEREMVTARLSNLAEELNSKYEAGLSPDRHRACLCTSTKHGFELSSTFAQSLRDVGVTHTLMLCCLNLGNVIPESLVPILPFAYIGCVGASALVVAGVASYFRKGAALAMNSIMSRLVWDPALFGMQVERHFITATSITTDQIHALHVEESIAENSGNKEDGPLYKKSHPRGPVL